MSSIWSVIRSENTPTILVKGGGGGGGGGGGATAPKAPPPKSAPATHILSLLNCEVLVIMQEGINSSAHRNCDGRKEPVGRYGVISRYVRRKGAISVERYECHPTVQTWG